VAEYRRDRDVIRARNNVHHARTHPRRLVTCKGCAERFLAKRVDSTFCSLDYWWKWFSQTPTRQVAQRAQASKRRAWLHGAASVERVDACRVFARDGWRCQLCGAATDKGQMGKRHPRAPTMDHIVPLARGGDHSYRNIQCACLLCNLKKGARLQGQSRLF
jgi:5-methylcytosine-specific restriction endonuclease McrA